MKKYLAMGLVACVASANAVTLFEDGFETGDFSKWAAAAGTGTTTVQSATVHTGAFAAQIAGAVGSGRYGNLSRAEIPGETIELTFWMKLGAAHGNNRHYNELRSYSGNAYGSGSLEQLYALGAYNASINSFTSTKWQARIAFGTGAGWYTLTDGPLRNTDWNKFTIKVMPTTIEFYVNDVLGLATAGRGNTGTIDSVILGSRLSSVSIDSFHDDLIVTAVPEPASLAALALGAGTLLRRRRRA